MNVQVPSLDGLMSLFATVEPTGFLQYVYVWMIAGSLLVAFLIVGKSFVCLFWYVIYVK